MANTRDFELNIVVGVCVSQLSNLKALLVCVNICAADLDVVICPGDTVISDICCRYLICRLSRADSIDFNVLILRAIIGLRDILCRESHSNFLLPVSRVSAVTSRTSCNLDSLIVIASQVSATPALEGVAITRRVDKCDVITLNGVACRVCSCAAVEDIRDGVLVGSISSRVDSCCCDWCNGRSPLVKRVAHTDRISRCSRCRPILYRRSLKLRAVVVVEGHVVLVDCLAELRRIGCFASCHYYLRVPTTESIGVLSCSRLSRRSPAVYRLHTCINIVSCEDCTVIVLPSDQEDRQIPLGIRRCVVCDAGREVEVGAERLLVVPACELMACLGWCWRRHCCFAVVADLLRSYSRATIALKGDSQLATLGHDNCCRF